MAVVKINIEYKQKYYLYLDFVMKFSGDKKVAKILRPEVVKME